MEKRVPFVLMCLLTSAILVACGPSQAERDAQATKIAADIFAAQTAEPPTLTPTPTSTPVPTSTPMPTSTPAVTPLPTGTLTVTPQPTDVPTWRIYPSTDLYAFSYAGDFEGIPNELQAESWEIAERIAADDLFMIPHPEGDYNTWAALEEVQTNIRTNEIPHTLFGGGTFAYIEDKYGEPDYISSFRITSGEKMNVYWYGPIFLMADDSKGEIEEVGGWPSRLGQGQPSSTAILPAYDWTLMVGDNIIRIHSPDDSGVLIGLRSRDPLGYILGLDLHIAQNELAGIHLQPGYCDVFLVFDNNPGSLFQGDSLDLKASLSPFRVEATEIEIYLGVEGGDYQIHRVE